MASALLRLGLAMVSVVLLLSAAGTPDATAGSNLDQSFTGNPDCSGDAYQGFINTLGTLDMEFVPQEPTLDAVEVCGHVIQGYPGIDVTVRRGQLPNLGEIIATGPLPGTETDAWNRLDFAPVAVTPGEHLVIEVTGYWTWESTCTQVGGSCDHIDSDQYLPGEGYYDGSGLDMMFRSYGSDEPGGTPAPLPYEIQWGDLDCSFYYTPADALVPLRTAAGIQQPGHSGIPCPHLGDTVTVHNQQTTWGNVDCADNDPTIDALLLLTLYSNQFADYTHPDFCPHPYLRVNVYAAT
jgi:hypothetical protein